MFSRTRAEGKIEQNIFPFTQTREKKEWSESKKFAEINEIFFTDLKLFQFSFFLLDLLFDWSMSCWRRIIHQLYLKLSPSLEARRKGKLNQVGCYFFTSPQRPSGLQRSTLLLYWFLWHYVWSDKFLIRSLNNGRESLLIQVFTTEPERFPFF